MPGGRPPGRPQREPFEPLQEPGQPVYDGRASKATSRADVSLEVKMKRLAALADARERSRESRMSVQAQAAIIHSPLDHLNKYKRAEWEVVCRYLADPLMSHRDIAKIMGYRDHTSIRRILQRPRVRALLNQIRAKQVEAVIKGDFGATALLKQSQTKAAKKVVETIEDEGAGKKLNLEAAKDVLDRTGLGKQMAIEHHHVHEILRHFTPDELDRYGKTGEPPSRFAEVFRQLTGPTGEE